MSTKTLTRTHLMMLSLSLTLVLLTPVVSSAGPAMPGVPGPDKEGWISLFNGTSLEGWKQHNGQAKYEVKDGAIVGKAVADGPNSFLCSKQMYGDFILEFEVKVDKGLNSGVQIRSHTHEDQKHVRGPQVEIEAAPGESGYIYGEATGRGWLSPDRNVKDAFQNDEWNQYRVKATGSRIQTWVNGQNIADLRDEQSPRRGLIGLQVHSVGKDKAGLKVRWRNIRVKPLDRNRWSNLFNGRNLNGWRNPYFRGKAEVVNGEIHLTSQTGKFFLATKKKYDDFILEASVRVPDRSSNSGIQFRSHVESNNVYGYQAEVDPSDRSWSGGIYDEGRRGWIYNLKSKPHAQSAFEPLKWNRYRIHAEGNRLRVYVNGLKTADLTDKKDQTGYIALQHHGEKGKVYRFRNIRIQNLDQ